MFALTLTLEVRLSPRILLWVSVLIVVGIFQVPLRPPLPCLPTEVALQFICRNRNDEAVELLLLKGDNVLFAMQ